MKVIFRNSQSTAGVPRIIPVVEKLRASEADNIDIVYLFSLS
jgi:hypothetical protein